MLCKSNMILFLAFLMVASDYFTETKFNNLMKDTKHDNLLVMHLMFEIKHNLTKSPSAGTTQDLITFVKKLYQIKRFH